MAVLGWQNSTAGAFYFWKSRDFASICLTKGVTSRSSLNMLPLTPPPPSFTRVLLIVTTKEDRMFTSFSGSLKFPDFTTHSTCCSPPGHGTGRREARFLKPGQHSCLGKHNRHFTLIYPTKFCKQPRPGQVHTHSNAQIYHETWGDS